MRARELFWGLAVVAISSLPVRAQIVNYAPVIDHIPDIIVGDAENSSAANCFVFPDAFMLDSKVHDDLTSPGAIVCSYTCQSDVYRLNNTDSIDPAVDNIVNPPASKRIMNHLDPMDQNNANSVTVRDSLRSPISGESPYPALSSINLKHAYVDSRVVTLFASDGTTFTSQSFVVYTLDNGYDGYSGPCDDYSWGRIPPPGWEYGETSEGTASGFGSQQGLCIMAHKGGSDDANWSSPYGTMTLTAGSAWEVRLRVRTTATTANSTPTWVFVYDNYGRSDEPVGNNEYGGEIFFLDSEGGANSAIPGIGRTEFRVWMMPIAEQTPQFANSVTGFLQPLWDSKNDMRMILRVMGLPMYSYSSYDAASVCWESLAVNKHELSDMIVESEPISVSRFVDGNTSPALPNGFNIDVVGDGAKIDFNADGSATIAPTTNWNTGTCVLFRPGDNQANVGLGAENWVDNFPIPWVADKLYYIQYELSAPSAWAEYNQPDVIRVGADTATNELLCDNFAVPNTPDLSGGPVGRGVSTPRFGPPQKYGCFFYTHTVSRTSIVDGARWRPKLDILTSHTVSPNGRTTNAAGVTVHSVSVKQVHFAK